MKKSIKKVDVVELFIEGMEREKAPRFDQEGVFEVRWNSYQELAGGFKFEVIQGGYSYFFTKKRIISMMEKNIRKGAIRYEDERDVLVFALSSLKHDELLEFNAYIDYTADLFRKLREVLVDIPSIDGKKTGRKKAVSLSQFDCYVDELYRKVEGFGDVRLHDMTFEYIPANEALKKGEQLKITTIAIGDARKGISLSYEVRKERTLERVNEAIEAGKKAIEAKAIEAKAIEAEAIQEKIEKPKSK